MYLRDLGSIRLSEMPVSGKLWILIIIINKRNTHNNEMLQCTLQSKGSTLPSGQSPKL